MEGWSREVKSVRHLAYTAPALVLLAVGFGWPLVLLVVGLGSNGFTFPARLIVRVEMTTIELAITVSVAATALATALALVVRNLNEWVRRTVFFLCLFPMGVNIAFRVFGVQYLLSPEGPLVATAEALNLSLNPGALLFTRTATTIGLIHWTFPVVVPLMFVAATRLDEATEHAALLLGAPQRAVVFRVILPQLGPAIATSFTLSFCLAYGSFITPAALGGINDVTITRLIGSFLADGRGADASAAAVVALLGPTVFVLLFWLALRAARMSTMSTRHLSAER